MEAVYNLTNHSFDANLLEKRTLVRHSIANFVKLKVLLFFVSLIISQSYRISCAVDLHLTRSICSCSPTHSWFTLDKWSYTYDYSNFVQYCSIQSVFVLFIFITTVVAVSISPQVSIGWHRRLSIRLILLRRRSLKYSSLISWWHTVI